MKKDMQTLIVEMQQEARGGMEATEIASWIRKDASFDSVIEELHNRGIETGDITGNKGVQMKTASLRLASSIMADISMPTFHVTNEQPQKQPSDSIPVVNMNPQPQPQPSENIPVTNADILNNEEELAKVVMEEAQQQEEEYAEYARIQAEMAQRRKAQIEQQKEEELLRKQRAQASTREEATRRYTPEEMLSYFMEKIKEDPANPVVLSVGGQQVMGISERVDDISRLHMDPNEFKDRMSGVNIYINGEQKTKEEVLSFIENNLDAFINAMRARYPDLDLEMQNLTQQIQQDAVQLSNAGVTMDQIRNASQIAQSARSHAPTYQPQPQRNEQNPFANAIQEGAAIMEREKIQKSINAFTEYAKKHNLNSFNKDYHVFNPSDNSVKTVQLSYSANRGKTSIFIDGQWSPVGSLVSACRENPDMFCTQVTNSISLETAKQEKWAARQQSLAEKQQHQRKQPQQQQPIDIGGI